MTDFGAERWIVEEHPKRTTGTRAAIASRTDWLGRFDVVILDGSNEPRSLQRARTRRTGTISPLIEEIQACPKPPKLHVDTDWKAEAQAEKASAAKAAEKTQGGDPAQQGELLPADFKSLMGLLASQAIMGLGAYTDPQSGGVVVDLPGAKFAIDLLGVLEEKTKGNLDESESEEMTKVVTELRSRFVQIAQLVAQQRSGSAAACPAPILNRLRPTCESRNREPTCF